MPIVVRALQKIARAILIIAILCVMLLIQSLFTAL
jgi:hypothetical protein